MLISFEPLPFTHSYLNRDRSKTTNQIMKPSSIAALAAKSIGAACAVSLLSLNAGAAILTFDDIVNGVTIYSYDGDGDGITDVTFSTTDPGGFNTFGPGPNMTFINEPGIEGTALLNPDLRVDFLSGASGPLKFGFALSAGGPGPDVFANFSLFNSSGVLLGEQQVFGDFTLPNGVNQSSFPEGQVSISFPGTAAYGLFNFSGGDRYIIDNFEGQFGSSEVPPSVPDSGSTLLLCGIAAAGLRALRRKLA